jgi:hypothetical protein
MIACRVLTATQEPMQSRLDPYSKLNTEAEYATERETGRAILNSRTQDAGK